MAVGAGKLQGTAGTPITGLQLESQGSIVMGSGKDLNLVNPTFKLSAAATRHLIMYAQDTMTVSNPTFTNFGSKSDVYMEATTVNLTDVNFPAGSSVKLVSRDGGTSNGTNGTGNYPKFGEAVTGRVNFISGIKYNSNPIGTTGQFDTYGSAISIRKTSQ